MADSKKELDKWRADPPKDKDYGDGYKSVPIDPTFFKQPYNNVFFPDTMSGTTDAQKQYQQFAPAGQWVPDKDSIDTWNKGRVSDNERKAREDRSYLQYTREDENDPSKEWITQLKKGEIIGPFKDGSYAKVTEIKARENLANGQEFKPYTVYLQRMAQSDGGDTTERERKKALTTAKDTRQRAIVDGVKDKWFTTQNQVMQDRWDRLPQQQRDMPEGPNFSRPTEMDSAWRGPNFWGDISRRVYNLVKE